MSSQALTARAAHVDERRALQRLQALRKARQTVQARVERQRKDEQRARAEFKRWLTRERIAYTAHSLEPDDRKLLRAWARILAEQPSLYGPRAQAT